MSDSFNAFKLHSLTTSTLNSPTAPPKIIPFCICTHCTNLVSLNHHLGDEGGSTRRGLHGQSQQSSRWSPTPAQLLVLEELYRQGTKTPTAEQIQQIASQLRRFGKIEGKNVFYWFQNHKARERQKRRRREMEETANSDSAEDKELYINVGTSDEKQDAAGLRGTGYEVKETKKWASTSNCSGLAEEPVSRQEIAESGPNGWTKLKDRGTQVLKENTTARSTSASERRKSFPQNLTSQYHNLPFVLNGENCTYCDDEEYANTRTLELFPLKRDDQDGIFLNERKSRFHASTSLGTEITSTQFFEFLPLKD